MSLLWRSVKGWNQDRGVALLAIIALAIGIGSASAIFTVVNAVLLKPLPYAQPDRWVELLGGDKHDAKHFAGLSYADCTAYHDRLTSFETLGWFPVSGDYNLTSPGLPRHLEGIELSHSILAATGAAPVAGRFFTSSDGLRVAVISDRLRRQLGERIVGRAITLNDETYTVVGAMPAWFRLPIVTVFNRNSENDVWIPLKPPRDQQQAHDFGNYSLYGKLKPGISFTVARAEALRVAAQLQSQNHPTDSNYTVAFHSLRETVAKEIQPILLLLFGAAALLLLITCANVAGLLVSRAVGRSRDIAIRIAIGCGQAQLALEYFLESFWLSSCAVVAGMLLCLLLVKTILLLTADYIPRYDEIQTDWKAAAFALVLVVLTATLSSLAPLWQTFRTSPNAVLSNGVRASAGVQTRRLSRILVIAEIALAFTLISTGTLLLSNFQNLQQISPGFDPHGLISFQLTRAAGEAQAAAFEDRAMSAVDAIPGVTGAAVVNQIPLTGCCLTTSLFPRGAAPGHLIQEPVSLMVVSSEYFKLMGIPLLSGRLLTDHDTSESLLSIVIDDAAAQRYWPNHNALGAFGRLGGENGGNVQVVGIVGPVKNNGLGRPPTPEIYLLNKIAPSAQINFVVRSTLPRAGLISAIHRAIAHVDPAQPIYNFRSIDEIVASSLTFQRIEWVVVTFFALAALLMASLGVYGLTSYSVRQRTTELGTRMALGATASQVLQLVTLEALRLASYGMAFGAIGVVAATVVIQRFFDVQFLKPLPYLASIFILLIVTQAASFIPAWRASLLHPMVAIRNDSESIWISARKALQQARQRAFPASEITLPDASLLTEFVESSRKADSFAAALQAALQDLGNRLQVASAYLLENAGTSGFYCVASVPENSNITLPNPGFLASRLRSYSAPMSFMAADLNACLRWAASQNPRQTTELELLQSIELRLAVALKTKQEIAGLLLLGQRSGQTDWTASEKTLVAACAEQFALTMENARLNQRVLEQEKVRRDLELATEVQRRLLPDSSPQTPATSFGAFTLAARSIGGDYYDFFQVGEKNIGIALADVAGKGIAAALIMAVVQASLRVIAEDDHVRLPELAAKLNRFLHRSTGFSSYATFFYAQLDEEKRQLRYVNAGHNPPYLLRANSTQTIEELAVGGMIIGMFPAASYEEATVQLNAGDVLIAFTDGVTEALNLAGEEFSEERLKILVSQVAHLPIAEMTAAISTALRHWIGEAIQHDDITFIVMKVAAEADRSA